MKPENLPSMRRFRVLLGAGLLLLPLALPAAVKYWDINGATAGAGGATPSGNWSSAFWSTSSAGTLATGTWVGYDDAYFAAGTDATGEYTVTLNANLAINHFVVQEGNVTINGFQLNKGNPVTGPNFSVAAGSTATINSNIGSANYGFDKIGAGTLVLAGNVTYASANTNSDYWLKVDDGTLRIAGGTHTNPALLVTGWAADNAAQTFEQTGGTFNQNNAIYWSNGATGGDTTLNFSGGLFNANGQTVNFAERRAATMTVSGTADVRLGAVNANGVANVTRAAIINLNGGTLTATSFSNTASNSSTFAINFNGGTLKASAASATFIATSVNTVTINAGGATIDSDGFAITIPKAMGGTGGLTKTGAGTLSLTANNNYSGATTVNAGVLTISGVGVLSNTSSVTINDGTTVNLSGSSNNQLRGTWDIGGTLNVTTASAHTMYGDVTLNNGTMAATVAGNTTYGAFYAGANRMITANGGANTISGSTHTLGIATGATLTLNTPLESDALNVSGAIVPGNSGTGGLSKIGDGTLTLSGASTFTGGTTVSDGLLIATSTSALGTNSGLTLAGGVLEYRPTAAGALNLGTGVLNFANDSRIGTVLAGTVSQSAITSTGVAVATGNTTVDVRGLPLATSTGTHNLITAGSGLTAGGATYSLGNVYNATHFTVDPGGFNATDTAITLAVTTATPLGTTYWKGGLSGAAGEWAASNGITAGNWALDAGGTATPLTPGAGATLTFSASGATNQGAMTLGDNMSIAGVVVNDTSALTLNADGKTLTLGTGGITVNSGAGAVALGAPVVLNGNQAWSNASANTLTVSGAISGSSTLTKNGTGTLALTGVNTYTGATTISASGGTLQIAGAGVLNNGAYAGAIAIGTGGTLQYSSSAAQTLSGGISGAGGLLKDNSGTLTLTGTNNIFTGGAVLAGGVVLLNASGYSSTTTNGVLGSGAIIVQSGGELQVQGSFNLGKGQSITLAGGELKALGGANYLHNLQITSGGDVTTGGGGFALGYAQNSAITLSGTQPAVISSNLTLVKNTGTQVTFTVADATSDNTPDLTVTGNMVDNASFTGLALIKAGAGTLVFSGANTYAGVTTISGGVLQIGNGGTTGTLGTGGTVTNNAALTFNRSNDLTVANVINGSGTVTQNGAGVLTLSGGNGYSGLTNINDGTLAVGNASALGTGGTDASRTIVGSGGALNLNGNRLASEYIVLDGGWLGNNGSGTGGSGTQQIRITVTANGGTIGGSGNWDNRASSGVALFTVNNGALLTKTDANTINAGVDGSLVNNGEISIQQGDFVLTRAAVSGTGFFSVASTGTLYSYGTLDNPLAVNLNGGVLRAVTSTNVPVQSGGVTLQADSTVNVEGTTTFTVSGVLSQSGGAYGFTKTGTGNLALSNAGNNFTGALVIEGGTVSAATVAPLAGAGSGSIQIKNAATLQYSGTVAGSLSRGLLLTNFDGGKVDVSNSAGSLAMTTISGATSDFVKTGPGTFSISGSSEVNKFYVNQGTYSQTGGTTVINTTEELTGLQLNGGHYRLEAGTLRTDRMALTSGGSFAWGVEDNVAGYATLTMKQEGARVEPVGIDRTGSGGAASGPVVKEGTSIKVTGDLTTTNRSILDLGPTYYSNARLYDNLSITGTLNLSAADDTLNFGINPYFLRPSGPNDVETGDWGTLVLVRATSITGVLVGDKLIGFDKITGIGDDVIGWSEYDGDPVDLGSDPYEIAMNLPINTWYVQTIASGFNDAPGVQGSYGVVLFHYKVAGSVPEPASAGLMVAGALVLRALRRRTK